MGSEQRHVMHVDEVEWVVVPDMPHHHGMLGKHLSNATGLENLPVSYEVQSYKVGGYQEPAVHEGGFHLMCVLQGEGEYTIGGKTYPIRPGSTVMIPPNTSHGMHNTGKSELVMFAVHGSAAKLSQGK